MIYLDNSATTYPKPPSVQRSVQTALQNYGFNPGRGGYRRSIDTAQKVFEARQTIRRFFNAPSEESVIFTPGCTHALNTVIKGVLKKGDHVIVSSFEHNAVLRPIFKLSEQGFITYTVADVAIGDDEQTLQNFRESITSNTRMMICTHASNVFGFRLPARRLCALAHSYGILFCLDAAQSAGVFSIDMQDDGYDFVCCAGHKYLYAPMGIGLLLIGHDNTVSSLIEGGTGSVSDDLSMPGFYPDRLEAGTLNLPGIIGLQAGVRFVERQGTDAIFQKEKRLIRTLSHQLADYRHIKVYTNPNGEENDAPVLAFTVDDADSETIVRYLSEHHDIAVRGGLHCAPEAHRKMGTISGGAVRIAPSVYTTQNDIRQLLNSLRKFR